MTTFSPYCLSYITWRNPDGSLKPRQVKTLPKNVRVEVLQSFFKKFAEESIREKYGDLMGDEILFNYRKELCEEMLRLFRNHEIYTKKTEEQRKEIEDFLTLHPETIEVARHYFDRYNFNVTDDFEVVGIKENAHYVTVSHFLKSIAENLSEELKTNPQLKREFILKTMQETDYFKGLPKVYQKKAIDYIINKLDTGYNRCFISVFDERDEIEDYIAKQSIKKYRADNNLI